MRVEEFTGGAKKALPYVFTGLLGTNFGEAIRMSTGSDASEKILSFMQVFPEAFRNFMPSFHPFDLMIGAAVAAVFALIIQVKRMDAKKYRQGVEYGSARWGTRKDIQPFINPDFQQNVILTQTESLTMESRPKNPKYARNKNVLIIGGSGSGKTRFWLKPNLLQMHSSYVITDPKGEILLSCGNALLKNGYQIRVLNTINFWKSMKYNPFAYIHSEKDILKLVTALIANTKGEGKAGDEFWTKAETLLYTALIGYIHYEAPEEEQNFNTLLEMLNSMEVREDDEDFENAVDIMFKKLEKKDSEHFAVRQYKKFKMAAGVITSKSSFNTRDNKVCVEADLRGFLHNRERRTLLCRKATSLLCTNVCLAMTNCRANRTVSVTRRRCLWTTQSFMTCRVRCTSPTMGSPAPASTVRALWP